MESGIATLRALRARAPSLRCVLLADYADLPEIVGARARGLLSRVIPNGAAAPALAAGLRAALEQEEEPSSSRSTVRGEAGDALDALIHFSATRLAQVQGAIVRPLAPDPRALQLQFVLRGEKRIESLRRDLNRRWGLPIKARGGDLATRWRGHPAPKRLGRLTGEAELWCVQPEGEPSCAYLALLPWSREPRLTAVVGLVAPGASASAAGLLADAHRQALSALAEFSLPAAPETVRDERLGTAAPEYDWIVTNTYVGLDRRQAPTTLLNRFIFFGRRRHVPARLLRATDSFTDRPSRRVLPWFILYIAFATVDTVLTWWCVRTGLVRESNPLLRPLVLHHPAVYLLVKNGLALLAFLVIARFQLFRIGGLLLTAAVLAWVALDLYWLALLVRMRG
jgi:hypothetical protein